MIIPIRRFEAFVGLGLQTNLRIQTSGTVLLHEEAKYTPPREKLFVFDDSEYDAVTNSYVVEAGLRYQRFQLSANSAGEFSAYFNIPSEDIRLYTISIGYTLL